jgi:hypothetical protein
MPFKNTLSSLLKRNGKPYRLQRSEVNKYSDNGTGRFQYVRHDHFTHQKDSNGALLRSYYSSPVDDQMTYEGATKDALAFSFDASGHNDLVAGRCVSVNQINMGSDERSHTRTWGQEWNFEDGSSVVELIASSNL